MFKTVRKIEFRKNSTAKRENCFKRGNIEAVVQRCSVKKGVLGNFTKFTGKHLCQSLFFNKVQVFSCEFCEISKNAFFHRTPLVAVSENIVLIILHYNIKSKITAKLKIFHLFATALVLRRSRRQKREKK